MIAPTQLAAELTASIDGEVRFDDGYRAMYAYDASVYRQTPIGVVIPRHAEDVVSALEICRAYDVPLLPRGSGTSLNGQCCNVAVVFDFSKYLHGIVDLDPRRKLARVLPGTILDSLRNAAEAHRLTFGPDPATHDSCSLGGMIGNNACGTHSLIAGRTSDNVEELEILTYDGLRMRVGRTSAEELESTVASGGRRGEIYAGLKRLRDRYAAPIRQLFPAIPRRVSGYNLDELLPENDFNVARALVGTEGTCAFVLEATVSLIDSPQYRTLVVVGYPTIPAAGRAVPELLTHPLIGLECFDRKAIANQQAKGLRFPGWDLLTEGDAWLLAEFGGASQEESDTLASAFATMLEQARGATHVRLVSSYRDQAAVWDIRRHAAGTTRTPVGQGGHAGWPNFEDAAVPPERLGDYLEDFLGLLDVYGYHGALYGHFGEGCVHCRLDFRLRSVEGVAKMRRFMEAATDLVVSYGGSISGEHGDGQRGELLVRMYGPEFVRAFEEFKALWDPKGRMNPGKVVDPYPLDVNLREGPGYRLLPLETHFAYPQDGGSFGEAGARCFGAGRCRHLEGGTMCPSYMVTREEMHSTRGRARLLLELAVPSSPIARDGWRSRHVKQALDLCLSCKGCKGECPVRVDIASYKSEFLSHYYARRLRPRTAYALGLVSLWARPLSRLPRLVNAAMQHPGLSQALKAAVGIAPQRPLPAFAPRTFRDWFRKRSPQVLNRAQEHLVLLWPDTFTNYFEPHIPIAATEVLEAAGFRVVIPDRWLCCGRPLYDYGMLTLAKRLLRNVLDELRPAIRGGVPLVGLEPSCVAVFRDELINFFPDDADARQLAQQSYVLAEFLADKASDFPLPKLGRKALVQMHCHQAALAGTAATQRVLERLGLDFEIPDSGCCGMAGSFGYESGEHYEVSMRCAERVILPTVREASRDTMILADGFSCRGQIAQGTARHPLHLAEVLHMGLRGLDPPDASAPAELGRARPPSGPP
ncbi:MAG: FAD-linked oxidase C-terminal domain-containing protein [Nitriliruptorales bacterium]